MKNILVRTMLRLAQRFRQYYNPEGHLRSLGIRFGTSCRFGPGINWGSEPYLIKLGDHVSITANVSFITHDGGVWVLRDRHPDLDVFGTIKIGNNTFIGQGSTILPGVAIGQNCIVGAGSVVTKPIPDNSVAAGVPARVIRSINAYASNILSHPNRLMTKGLNGSKKKATILQHFQG